MGATTAAAQNVMAPALIGAGYTASNNANAYIGVGDSTTAFAVGQTDLIGTNKLRNGMGAGFPTNSSGVLTFQATFVGAEANFAWQELGCVQRFLRRNHAQPQGAVAGHQAQHRAVADHGHGHDRGRLSVASA